MACNWYADYHLGDIDEAAWQRHLQDCPACAQVWAQDQAIAHRVRVEDVPQAGDALWNRIETALEAEAKPGRILSFAKHRSAWVWTGRVAAVLVAGIALGYGLGLRSAASGTLDDRALARFQKRETACLVSIDRLSSKAENHVKKLGLDDRLRFRDYLETLDRQIGEVREALAVNPGNRYLRQALQEALEEKRQALEELLNYRSPSTVQS